MPMLPRLACLPPWVASRMSSCCSMSSLDSVRRDADFGGVACSPPPFSRFCPWPR